VRFDKLGAYPKSGRLTPRERWLQLTCAALDDPLSGFARKKVKNKKRIIARRNDEAISKLYRVALLIGDYFVPRNDARGEGYF